MRAAMLLDCFKGDMAYLSLRRGCAKRLSAAARRAHGASRRLRVWPAVLLLQIREHCEHAPVVGRVGGQAKLPEDVRHVLLDGSLGDEEACADRLVRASLGHQS